MSESVFSKLDWLVGEWQGYGIVGKEYNLIRKTYAYEAAGTFLMERTLSMFPPGAPKSEYEMHQDFVVFYENGDKLSAKGFYIEGFVSGADLEVAADGGEIVITSTSVENGPPGHHTRYTLTRTGDDSFEGTFEMAWSAEEELQPSMKLKMQRIA